MAQPSILESLQWHLRSWEQIQQTALFILSNYATVLALLISVAVGLYQIKSKRDEAKKRPQYSVLEAPDFPPITKLKRFDWKTAEPSELPPFKPKYHLTMEDSTALSTLSPDELLLMDKNYETRIQHRRQIIEENPGIALGVSNERRIRPAVSELYTFLTGTYLPSRYPSMFRIHHTQYEHGAEAVLQNLVTGEMIPTRARSPTAPPIQQLKILGRHLDEDFLFLLPEEEDRKKQGGDAKYVLEAYVSCCPSGFNPAEKLGKKLGAIHGPVPGYAEKLEGSMDRYFAKLEVGKYVKRVNWSITMNEELFQPGLGSNHAREGEEVVEFQGKLDPEKTFVRSERQTLHRLPGSKALVFAFKTYMYPLREIRDEGIGEELATAIDGLKEGNVPEMHFYKRGEEWGTAVKAYLRSPVRRIPLDKFDVMYDVLGL